MNYEWLGLVASAIWAFTMIMAVVPASHLGSVAFNRYRMLCASLILTTAALIINGYQNFNYEWIFYLVFSGIVGIGLGDLALYASLNRLGPRLAELLFATNALFAIIFGITFFNETLTFRRFIGISLICGGTFLTLLFSDEKKKDSRFATTNLPVYLAVICGLISAACQAGGQAIAKPALDQGANPIAASSIRMITALLWHLFILFIFPSRAKAKNPLNLKIFAIVFFNAFLALGIAMTCVLAAVSNGNLGLVAVLSSCAPVLLLPLMWFYYHKKPQKSSWFAAIIVLIGTAVIFLEPHS